MIFNLFRADGVLSNKQALEKLRGKNGDVKITAKDGFCMQKLLGGCDQDINWCPDWSWQILSKDVIALWCLMLLAIYERNEPVTKSSSRWHGKGYSEYSSFCALQSLMVDKRFLISDKLCCFFRCSRWTLSLSLSVNLYLFSIFYTATSYKDSIIIIKKVCWIRSVDPPQTKFQSKHAVCSEVRSTRGIGRWQARRSPVLQFLLEPMRKGCRCMERMWHDVDFRMDWIFMNFLPPQISSFHIHLNRHKVDGIIAKKWHSTIKVVSLYVSFFHFSIFLWRGTYWMF